MGKKAKLKNYIEARKEGKQNLPKKEMLCA